MKKLIVGALAALFCAFACSASATDWWASEVVSSANLGYSPYDDPNAIIGKPSVWMDNSGAPGDTEACAVMMVCPAWNIGLQGEKLITTIKAATQALPAWHITVSFETPVYDNPQNWHGKDFIVFGNSFFTLGGSYVYSGSNMESLTISSGGAIFAEPMMVSVSQDGQAWYPFTNGPYADAYAPTHALAWDWIDDSWLKDSSGAYVEMDFTKPVDPAYAAASFGGKRVSDAIDMYQGSGGGTAFDIASLSDLPEDPATGIKWFRYLKIDGAGGEADAVARVSGEIAPVSIGQAKLLADGASVVLNGVIVSAETYSAGRFCYVQDEKRSAGIKLKGRELGRGAKVNITGRLDTIDGERVLLPTSVLPVRDGGGGAVVEEARPLGMPNKAIIGFGLAARGLLVRTCGKVASVDSEAGEFVISDGSSVGLRCAAPRDQYAEGPERGSAADTEFELPGVGDYVGVTGINSTCKDIANNIHALVRLRDSSDMTIYNTN